MWCSDQKSGKNRTSCRRHHAPAWPRVKPGDSIPAFFLLPSASNSLPPGPDLDDEAGMADDLRAIQAGLAAFIRESEGDFPDLALRLFRFQFAHNRPYQAYCRSLGASPRTVRLWDEIPPVPADAFRTPWPLTCFPHRSAERVFLTSGTTSEVRGRHYLPDLLLYRTAVLEGWRHAELPDLPRRLFVARDPAVTPESSLGGMFSFLASDEGGWLLDENGHLRLGPLLRAIESDRPLILFSTALGLKHLFEQAGSPLLLPAGSWVFQTGGYKGLAEAYDPAALVAGLEQTLGVPANHVINEYGMTELSSQAYAIGLRSPHHCPPWMRVHAIDPETNAPLPAGEPGYLVLRDLANAGSVLAVRTQDFGCALDPSTFILEGRDPGALPRGCSRAS